MGGAWHEYSRRKGLILILKEFCHGFPTAASVLHVVSLPHGAMVWSVIRACGTSWSYSIVCVGKFKVNIYGKPKENNMKFIH